MDQKEAKRRENRVKGLKITISRGVRWIFFKENAEEILKSSQNNYLTRGEMDMKTIYQINSIMKCLKITISRGVRWIQ